MIWEDLLKLLVAMLLGGIIGLEREVTNNPAGFRTHTLLCMGAALVMITSRHVFEAYHDIAVLDPLRLGAQVISGIGFLGAGTIMKDGSRVRGLTTAASLWVVACVGLAVGVGLYWLAAAAALLACLTLILLKKAEEFFIRDSGVIIVMLDASNSSGQIAKILEVMKCLDVHINNINMAAENSQWIKAKFHVKLPSGIKIESLFTEIEGIEGISTDVEQLDE